jgi:accessory gene regulator B
VTTLNHFGDWLVINQLIAKEDKELYVYGLRQGFLLVLNIASVLLLALALDLFWQSMVFLAGYYPLRTYAGGYHAKSPLKCYACSLILIVTVLGLMRHLEWSSGMLIISALAATSILVLLAPMQADKKPLDESERCLYRRKALRLTGCLLLLLAIAVNLGWRALAGCLDLSLLSVSALLLLGLKDTRVARIT